MCEVELAELMYLVDLYTENYRLEEENYDRFFELGNKYTGAGIKNNGAMCVKRMYFKVKGYKL